ncbi:MAG: PAS domain-containing protein [Bradymonadaceae bacterium]|nr:PAS domain-containing protein [Lujinxingiaceae bacterium]
MQKLKVLILGHVPEEGNIFSRTMFTEDLPASTVHIEDPDEFVAAINKEDIYSLILIDITPYGLEVLEQVRQSRPACPVIMISDPDQAQILLEAKRKGLEAYLVRGGDRELFTDLLAEEIYTQLFRFVEPPEMESPSADEMYRYAQYHNVLEPFFVVARKRYLLYINKAGRNLSKVLHGVGPYMGDPLETWVLEGSIEEFDAILGRAFAGHEAVHERAFPEFDDGELRELHYQPVTDPTGRVVAVSICVHRSGRPELERARTVQVLAEMAGWVSHDQNNLLNILMSNADLLAIRLAELGDEEAMSHLSIIEQAIKRSTIATSDLQAFSRLSVSQPVSFNLNDVIADVLVTVRDRIGPEAELNIDLASELPDIKADRRHWETVVANLIQNGADEMVDGAKVLLRTCSVRVTLSRTDLPVEPGTYVLMEIIFEGRVMAGWLRDQHFDPLFTTRRVARRGGLELATAKSIIEQVGGRIVVESTEDETIVRVYCPASGDSK